MIILLESLNEYAVLLTIIAAFSQSAVLAVTLFVFYRNLNAIRKHNQITSERFEVQSKVERFTLTLKFADWIKSELNDYTLFLNSDEPHAYLTKDEIKMHFESIAKNIIELSENKIIVHALLADETKKLFSVISSFSKNKELILSLKKLSFVDVPMH